MKNLLKIVAVLGVALLLVGRRTRTGDQRRLGWSRKGYDRRRSCRMPTVEATNLATGAKATPTTNAQGEYHFVNLPAGHYSLHGDCGRHEGRYCAMSKSF